MNISEIKKQLPSGAIKTISQKTGIRYETVQQFFSGKKTKKDLEIIEETANFLTEHKEKTRLANEKLKAAANS